jgi:hypothetical protein
MEAINYYSGDCPQTPLEEFLATYERLTKHAKGQIHDVAESLATGSRAAGQAHSSTLTEEFISSGDAGDDRAALRPPQYRDPSTQGTRWSRG